MTESSTSGGGRQTYPADGADPREGDVDRQDDAEQERIAAERHVTHDQPVERAQGTSADAPGVNPADRDSEDGGQPTFE